MTDELLLVILLVQKVEAGLMRHLLHVAQALIVGHPYVLYWKETRHDLSPLSRLWSGYFLGSKVSSGPMAVFLRGFGPSLDPFVIC